MTSKLKITLLIVGVFVIGLTVWVSYYASHVSSVISSIKDYEFSSTEKQLENSVLKVIRSDTSLTYKVTRITGNKEGRKYYLDLSYKHNVDNCLFNVCIENKKQLFSREEHSSVHLIGAFNVIDETGGYKITDLGMPKLVHLFEELLITKLPKK